MFAPRYRITGKVAKALMAIEADRQVVAMLPLNAPMLDSLRRTARLLTNLLLHRSGYGLNDIYSLEGTTPPTWTGTPASRFGAVTTTTSGGRTPT